jgi:hypothetical protein
MMNDTMRTIEKLDLKKNDVIIFKGNWNNDSIEAVGGLLANLDKQCFCIVLPENGSIESIPIKDFYAMMKEIEKRLGLDK